MKGVRIAGFVVVGLGLLGSSSTGAMQSRGEAACRVSAVHYRTVNRAPRGVAGPWVASTNSAFRGYLFYFGSTRWGRARANTAHIFTTKADLRVHPKVLWIALGRPGSSLAISGARLDGPGSFTARYPVAGAVQFPSYVNVPTAGCWRLNIRSGGLHGSVTFMASDTA